MRSGTYLIESVSEAFRGWSGGAMVLGNLPVPGRPTIWMIVGQGPIALAVGAGGGCLDMALPFLIQIVGRPDTGSLHSTIAPSDPPPPPP